VEAFESCHHHQVQKSKSATPQAIAVPAQISHPPARSNRDLVGEGMGDWGFSLSVAVVSPMRRAATGEKSCRRAPFSGMSVGSFICHQKKNRSSACKNPFEGGRRANRHTVA
jgi:hypothetical protein